MTSAPESSLPETAEIHRRLSQLQAEIVDECQKCGRSSDTVRLVAVTKTHPIRAMLDCLSAGVADLGENRVQEAVPKMDEIRREEVRAATGEIPRFHLIGHLQTNKARHVVAARMDLIHSVDSLELIAEIQKRCTAANSTQDILIQVNVSGEESKFGLDPDQLEPLLLTTLETCDRIRIQGLMTMAPFEMEPEETRPVFEGLRKLSEKMALRFHGASGFAPTHLSMGMTNDWRQAVAEGATLIRVGSALFGPR